MEVLRRVVDRLATPAVRARAEPGPASTRRVPSPAWSAPEQIEGDHAADSRTDVWAIGLVALRTITGRPFWRSDAGDFHGLAVEVTSAPLPSASARHEELARESWAGALDAWFARCVCRDRLARFADPAVALAQLASVVPSTSEAAGPAERPVPPRQRPRSSALLFAIGVLLAFGAAALVFAAGFGMGARARPTATTATPREAVSTPPAPAMEPLRPRTEPVDDLAARDSDTATPTPGEVLDPWAAPPPRPRPSAARRGHGEFVDPWAEP